MPTNKRLDFKLVKERSLIGIEQVLNHWLSQGKRSGSEWVSINPTRSDSKAGSFSVNLTTGIWADFACNDKGGDLISLIAYLDGSTQGQACKDLAAFLNIDATKPDQDNKPATKAKPPKVEWTPITPVSTDAPNAPDNHFRQGKYTNSWRYLSKSGELLCIICRFDKPDGRKEIMPLTYCQRSNGQKAWRWKGLADPRPLYNLDQLHKRRTATVIVTEGEKAADAASQLFPDCVVTTCLNGSMAPAKTDWSPLENRRVILWPDNDDAGRLCMEKISALFKANKVALLNLDYFLKLPNGESREALPDKWDAADALIDGYTVDGLKELFKDPKNLKTIDQSKLNQPSKPKTRKPQSKNTAQSTPALYQIIEGHKDMIDGVYFMGNINRAGENLPPLYICSPLHVTATTRDNDQSLWGFLLEWQDLDGTEHIWSMAASMTSGSGEIYRQELLSQGVRISANQSARNHLTTYILNSAPTSRARCTDSAGWHKKTYVLPNRTIYPPDAADPEKVIFQSSSAQINTFKQSGSLEDWKQNVSRYCIGNSRLIFAVSAAFAGMIIGLVDDDSAGIHWRGDSSTGKTTALRVAASVFGGREYMQRWRSTDNALESLASQHCDATLILDELAQMDPKSAGEIAYMLANGSGKARSNRNGTARPVTTWRLLYLSAGEIGLAEHMAQAGKKVRAGQEVRLLDIPVDAGAGMGMFEKIHGIASPAGFSRLLNQNATEYYGEPALAFIAKIQEHFADIPDLAKQAREEFSSTHVPEDASGQVHRACLTFALIGCAGELATEFYISGWQKGEAMQAASTCFEAWVNARGGTGNQEDLSMMNQFDQFFELHGESRFTPVERTGDNHSPRTINRAGFRKIAADNGELTFYVFPQVFNSEICDGFDKKAMVKLLIDADCIELSNSGKALRSVRLPGGSRSCYVIQLPSSVDPEDDEPLKNQNIKEDVEQA